MKRESCANLATRRARSLSRSFRSSISRFTVTEGSNRLQVRGSKSKALHDQALVNCQYSAATFSQGERKRRPRGDRKSQEMSGHLAQTFQVGPMLRQYWVSVSADPVLPRFNLATRRRCASSSTPVPRSTSTSRCCRPTVASTGGFPFGFWGSTRSHR